VELYVGVSAVGKEVESTFQNQEKFAKFLATECDGRILAGFRHK
jgi:hypothetical protein